MTKEEVNYRLVDTCVDCLNSTFESSPPAIKCTLLDTEVLQCCTCDKWIDRYLEGSNE